MVRGVWWNELSFFCLEWHPWKWTELMETASIHVKEKRREDLHPFLRLSPRTWSWEISSIVGVLIISPLLQRNFFDGKTILMLILTSSNSICDLARFSKNVCLNSACLGGGGLSPSRYTNTKSEIKSSNIIPRYLIPFDGTSSRKENSFTSWYHFKALSWKFSTRKKHSFFLSRMTQVFVGYFIPHQPLLNTKKSFPNLFFFCHLWKSNLFHHSGHPHPHSARNEIVENVYVVKNGRRLSQSWTVSVSYSSLISVS